MKIGDKVSVIDDDLSGTVTSVHAENVVFRDVHGFTHQYRKQDLVLLNASLYENLKAPQKAEHKKQITKKHSKNHLVLDLHIDQIVKNPEQYESFERLLIQREKLLNTLEFCRNYNLKKLEIIHGIGDGTLQKLVYDVLQNQTAIEFQNREILHHQSGSVMVYFT